MIKKKERTITFIESISTPSTSELYTVPKDKINTFLNNIEWSNQNEEFTVLDPILSNEQVSSDICGYCALKNLEEQVYLQTSYTLITIQDATNFCPPYKDTNENYAIQVKSLLVQAIEKKQQLDKDLSSATFKQLYGVAKDSFYKKLASEEKATKKNEANS
ncbi:PurT [Acrasis kona]|uniref:PurT n=1 Tax=Acrasis kona TaxID=1008807 RepID=A0AAW2ZSD5_9EUKA